MLNTLNNIIMIKKLSNSNQSSSEMTSNQSDIYLVEAFVNRSFKFKKDTLLRMIIPFLGGILIGVIYMAIFSDKINMIFGASL